MPDSDECWIDIGFRPGKATAGIRFRRFSGSEDFSTMSDICVKSWEADHIDFMKTREEYENEFKHITHKDPARDLLFAEVNDVVIAFAEIGLTQMRQNELLCFQYAHVLPQFRRDRLRETLVRFNEKALRDIVRHRPEDERKLFRSWALSSPNEWQELLLSEGYEPAWHLFEMVRPNLDNVPDVELPEGVTVRPTAEGDYRKVWDASKEMFMGEPWCEDDRWDEAHYEQWLKSPNFAPDLWQIAWHGDDIVGSVQSYIDVDENRTFDRKRGHTECIFVTPPWRGKGLAKALIARSLRLLKDRGMTEATLDTEVANVSEAYKVYQRMGYQVVKQFTFYQKPL